MELRIVAFQTVLPNDAPLQHGAVAPQVPALRAFRQRSETRPLLWRLERWLRRRQLVQAEQAVDGVFSMPPPCASTLPCSPSSGSMLGPLHGDALAPPHRADLAKSGLADATIQAHRFRSVPPDLIDTLLGFRTPTRTVETRTGTGKEPIVVSAYILPFPDPCGGWMDHVRVKVFPSYADRRGQTVKYLGPKGAAPRLFFCLATLDGARAATERLWLVEGAKKALAVAQLGLPAVGFEGCEAWHRGGAVTTLLPDFDLIPLAGRCVELVPDGDLPTNPAVRSAAARLADALRLRGARPRLVQLPTTLPRSA
jgi:hypothetical protein